jgi:hypothetical protein
VFIHRALATLIIAALPIAGCNGREDGLLPVGGAEVSVVEETRFLKRLYLDLTGLLPSEAEVAAGLDRLDREGNSPSTRAAMAAELLADPRFAAVFVGELENRVFGGGTIEDLYGLFCPVFQSIDPACASCAPTLDCSGCSCPRPDPDEVKNTRAMVFGTFVPDSPVGLLFHRLGENYEDLNDIVFTSEVYRESAVDRVFLRYLGRKASPEELAHFAGSLDPASPDIRPVILAVVSSGEYFSQ